LVAPEPRYSVGRDAFRHHVSHDLFPPHLRSKVESGDPDLDEAEWRGMRTIRRMKEGKPAYVVVGVLEGESLTKRGW